LFFTDPVDYESITKSLIVIITHTLALYLITLYLFIKKDILT
jgi:hypothetical protein